MNEKLYEFIMKLPKKNIINLMFIALEEIQGYNGQTMKECILKNLCEGEKKISLKEIKELME